MTTSFKLQRFNRYLAAAAAVIIVSGGAMAQERLRQATIIVGSPAGGATDKLARMYADALKQRYATTVIVENRPGAGGILAYEYVKNSPHKDGSITFLSPAYPLAISPHVVRNLPYDTLTDFVPVAIAARSTMTYVVGKAVPAEITSLAAYLQWCRDNPKQALYAAQTGSSQHLLGSILALSSRVPLENVSYKGDAPAVQDLLGGHVPAVVLPIASAIPLFKAGQIRVLAVSAAKPSRFLPGIQTFQELGHKDILFQDWLGVFAPAGTSPDAVRQMNLAMGDAVRSEQGLAALTNLGFTPEVVTPEQFAEIVRADHRRYGSLVERTKFREIFEKSQGK